ncbi:hypothetical protein D3C87_1934710 [compost metagenome]
MALALAAFAYHLGASKHCFERGAICGIVVVDVNARSRENLPKAMHDIADRRCLVIAGDQDCNRQITGNGARQNAGMCAGMITGRSIFHDFHSVRGKSSADTACPVCFTISWEG